MDLFVFLVISRVIELFFLTVIKDKKSSVTEWKDGGWPQVCRSPRRSDQNFGEYILATCIHVGLTIGPFAKVFRRKKNREREWKKIK
jgi:hypothetical protein